MGIKFEAGSAIDMLSLNFSNLLLGTPAKATSSKYELHYNNGYRDIFEGHGFKYDRDDIPKGGTVEEFTEYQRSKEIFEISGLSASVKSIVKAAFTDDMTDDGLIIIKAMRGNDRVSGSSGNDTLFGAGGNDRIDGGGGNDIILSGPGVDKMTGGSGGDAFVFLELSHSNNASQDVITDFTHADNLFLSNLGPGHFIGTAGFSGAAGEVRFAVEGNSTIVSGDFSGDGIADFSVRLNGAIALTDADFTF